MTLYEETLRSEPEDLLDRIRTATELIIDRFREIGLADPRIYSNEHRALCLALSDLRALRIAVSHSNDKMARSAVPSVRPVSRQMVSQDAHNEIALLLRFSRSCPARKLLAPRGRWRDKMANIGLLHNLLECGI